MMLAASEVVFTAEAATVVHGKPKQRARRCQHCRATFTPKRSTAKYCSDSCRVKAFKTRQKPRRRAAPVVLVHRRCAHCGASFEARNDRQQTYCSGSCKTLAYRARRDALVDAVAAYTGTSIDVAAESVEKHGMKRAAGILQMLGMVYDQRSRRWLIRVSDQSKVFVKELS